MSPVKRHPVPEHRIQDSQQFAHTGYQHRRSHYADAFNVAQVLSWFFKMVPDVGGIFQRFDDINVFLLCG